MSNYAPYVSLSVDHEYFSNSRAKVPIDVVPTSNTVEWLKHHHMFLKPTLSGVCIVADTDMLKELPAPSSDSLLQFKLFSNDPLFRNYTDLPLTTPMAAALFEVKADSKTSLSVFPKQWLTPEVILNNTQYEEISEFELSQNLVGIINLTISKADFYNQNKIIQLIYSHTYSYWQYYFLTSDNTKEYQIIDSNGEHQFDNKGTVILGERPYLVFRSSEPLPVLHRSELSLQLKANHKVVYRRLATAQPAHIEFETVNNHVQRLCHIYLA
ncbi:hypothetical protein [Vibrio sp. FJH11]